jgi:hypothetical protein
LAREALTVIIRLAGQAPHRRLPLSSNVRRHNSPHMSLSHTWFFDRLRKKARKASRGFPVASVAFYGPTDKVASKVVVGVTATEGADVDPLERWYSPDQDARTNALILKAILQFLETRGVKSVVMPDRLLGCPHEEGKDYPEGEQCPRCPYWHDRDRFTGLLRGNRSE